MVHVLLIQNKSIIFNGIGKAEIPIYMQTIKQGLQLQSTVLQFLHEDSATSSLFEHHRITGGGETAIESLIHYKPVVINCRRKVMKFYWFKP